MLLKTGSDHDSVRAVRELLAFLQVPSIPLDLESTVFDAKLEQVVEDFQAQEGLLVDGIVGPATLKAVQDGYTERVLELHGTVPDSTDGELDRIPFVRVPATPYKDGYDRFTLRAEVAEAYRDVYETVIANGGILPSSGGRRSLNAPMSPSRSATSFHYTGRALDIYIWAAMVDAAKDPLVVDRLGERRYRVYVRIESPQPEQSKLIRTSLDNVIEYEPVQRRSSGKKLEGQFLDLTALFEQRGFHPIRARSSFERGGRKLGAEWWHFQYEAGLIPNVTTFGTELLRVYARSTLEKTPPWRFRDRVFNVNWF